MTPSGVVCITAVTGTKTGASYSQSYTSSSTTIVHSTADDVDGSYTQTTTVTSAYGLVETGSAQGVTYTLQEDDTSNSTTQDSGDYVTTATTSTTISATTSTIHQIGTSTDGSFDLTKTGAVRYRVVSAEQMALELEHHVTDPSRLYWWYLETFLEWER